MSLITTIIFRSLLPLVKGSEAGAEYNLSQNINKLVNNSSLPICLAALIDNNEEISFFILF
jgi:hypothetical protein